MQKRKVRAKDKVNFLKLLFVFILIFLSNESLIVSANANSTFATVSYLVIGLSSIVVFLYNIRHRRRFSFNLIMVFVVLSILMLLTALFNADYDIKYIFQILVMFFAINLLISMPIKEFAKYFVNIIVFLSIFSFICSLVFLFIPQINSVLPLIHTKTGHTFVFYLFDNQKYLQDGEFYRNYSIFREPGVYIIYINIALLFNLYFNKKHKLRNYIILLIACATTLSTAGVIIFLFISAYYYIFRRKMIYIKKIYIVLGVLAIVIALLVFGNTFIQKIFGKITGDKGSTGSRVDSILISFKMWLHAPLAFILGNGTSYMEENFLEYATAMNSYATDNTNTLFKLLGTYGLPFFVVCVGSLFLSTKFYSKRAIERIMIFISFLLLLSNEDIMYNSLFYMFVFLPLVPTVQPCPQKYKYKRVRVIKRVIRNEENCCC